MLIGSNFNKLCKKILLSAGEQVNFEAGKRVSVIELAKILDLDRAEVRNACQYLDDLDLIQIETIGGPVLIGHISLTKKGIDELQKIQ